MTEKRQETYTIESVTEELRKLAKMDIPKEYRDWAEDGLVYVRVNQEADVLDFPNNLFAYMRKEPMPREVRHLVEGIYRQGIEHQSDIAACNLGSLYYTGMIGEQSYRKAKELYALAAEAGNQQAVENLAYCYYYGRDCEADYAKAYQLFAKGAVTGRINSLYKIGDMYENGYYVEEDKAEAARIWSHCIDMINDDSDLAEEYGADVYVRYAGCFLYGYGMEVDVIKALYWAQRAEYEFRLRELKNKPYAREGIRKAEALVSRCRYILDSMASGDPGIMLN